VLYYSVSFVSECHNPILNIIIPRQSSSPYFSNKQRKHHVIIITSESAKYIIVVPEPFPLLRFTMSDCGEHMSLETEGNKRTKLLQRVITD